MNTEPPEVRQGATGKWAFVLRTPEGKILAMSDWGGGRNKEFDERYWLALPLVKPLPSENTESLAPAIPMSEKNHQVQTPAQTS